MGGYKTAASANTAFFGPTEKTTGGLEGLSGRILNMTRSAVIRGAFLSSLHRTMCDARPGLEIFLSVSQSKQVSDTSLSLFLPLPLSLSISLALTRPHAQIDAVKIAQLGVYKNHNS